MDAQQDVSGTILITECGEQVVNARNVPADIRAGYIESFAATLPSHIAVTFSAQASERPDEWPRTFRNVNETYPDPASWEARVRCYEPGILHWQWADGSGFPPPEGERNDGD